MLGYAVIAAFLFVVYTTGVSFNLNRGVVTHFMFNQVESGEFQPDALYVFARASRRTKIKAWALALTSWLLLVALMIHLMGMLGNTLIQDIRNPPTN